MWKQTIQAERADLSVTRSRPAAPIYASPTENEKIAYPDLKQIL